MSEDGYVDIIVAIVACLGVISTALSGVLVARFSAIRRDVAAVKHEVKNDHKTNLREEQDVRHGENSEKLDYLVRGMQWLVHMALNNRADITELQDHTGQGNTRRARRLARERPPIERSDIPEGNPS